MKVIVLAAVFALFGCEATIPRLKVEEVQAGRSVRVASPVTIIEKRGPLALELEWQLLPGVYVERYRNELGRYFESDGPLVQFTPTIGEKTRSVGGFIVLAGQKGMGKLFVVKKGETYPHHGPVATAIGQLIVGPPGDFSLVTDFPLSRIPFP